MGHRPGCASGRARPRLARSPTQPEETTVDSQLNPLTRRGALKTAGAAAVAATTAALARPGPATAGGRGAGGRVDTHHHAVPEDMWRWAVDNGLLPPTGGPTWAHWRVE